MTKRGQETGDGRRETVDRKGREARNGEVVQK